MKILRAASRTRISVLVAFAFLWAAAALAALSSNSASTNVSFNVSYDDWLKLHFTPRELMNSVRTARNGDPDGDGVTNLMEYALGLDPREPDSDKLPRAEIITVAGEPYLQFVVTRPRGITDVRYQTEVSSDLETWTSTRPDQSTSSTDSDGATTTVTRVPLSKSAKRFIRLRLQ